MYIKMIKPEGIFQEQYLICEESGQAVRMSKK
jgi:hypothetical protein